MSRSDHPMDELVARATAQHDALTASTEQLTTVRGYASSKCGTVCAAVDCGGRLADLQFTSDISQLTGHEAGTLITETVAAAALQSARLRTEIFTSLNNALAGHAQSESAGTTR